VSGATRIDEEFLAPLRRVLAWMERLDDGRGRWICPDHGVEHVGKNVGAIVIACELMKHDPGADRARLLDIAVRQARRAVANLVREGDSACHTFRPGRHDPFNCSNSVIDGGACSDALATLVEQCGDQLQVEDRESFARASVLHARTYLRHAVLDKGIPAQRAWGLTGLAAAWRLERDPELERAAIEAVGMLEGIQHGDGSYPYHPPEWGGAHPGSGDVSAFYQSRIPGFLLHALGRLERPLSDPMYARPIVRALDFVQALQGPDGIKVGLVEAKPWYWGATHEVASHPFDAHALAAGHRRYGRPPWARAALRAFRAWVRHLDEDGAVRSHLPAAGRRRSYQCPVFWAGHAMWLARALPDLQHCLGAGAEQRGARGGIDLSVQWFPDAQLARLEDSCVVAWIRGARPAVNVHHGSPLGAGLLRVWSKDRERDLLERCRLGGRNEAEWSGEWGGWRLVDGWRANSEELRFSLWLARVAWRARRPLEALKAPFGVARRGWLAFAHPRVSSAFHLSPEVEVAGDGVRLVSALARRDGTVVPGLVVERSYSIDGAGLVVQERLLASAEAQVGKVSRLAYRFPAAAQDAEQAAGRASCRLA
jgi:hypothetical protein